MVLVKPIGTYARNASPPQSSAYHDAITRPFCHQFAEQQMRSFCFCNHHRRFFSKVTVCFFYSSTVTCTKATRLTSLPGDPTHTPNTQTMFTSVHNRHLKSHDHHITHARTHSQVGGEEHDQPAIQFQRVPPGIIHVSGTQPRRLLSCSPALVKGFFQRFRSH